jgi:hypothetical protein
MRSRKDARDIVVFFRRARWTVRHVHAPSVRDLRHETSSSVNQRGQNTSYTAMQPGESVLTADCAVHQYLLHCTSINVTNHRQHFTDVLPRVELAVPWETCTALWFSRKFSLSISTVFKHVKTTIFIRGESLFERHRSKTLKIPVLRKLPLPS